MNWWSELSQLKKWAIGAVASLTGLGGVWTVLETIPTGGPIHMDSEANQMKSEIVQHHDGEMAEVHREMSGAINGLQDVMEQQSRTFVHWRITPLEEDINEIEEQLRDASLSQAERDRLLRKMDRKERTIDCIRAGTC